MREPPYGIIWGHLLRGEVVPFLGAGASRLDSAGGSPALCPPSAKELAHALAEEAGFPSDDPEERCDLAKVSSFYEENAADRASLRRRLHDAFSARFQCGRLHDFLATLGRPLLIVTTNYDDLIEQAFNAKGTPFHLVVHPTDRKDLAASVLWWEPGARTPKDYPPNQLPLSLAETSIIYKMHGTVDRAAAYDSFVVTEEDYVDFLSRMTGQKAIPSRFALHFRQARFLFLGYGLRDWNLRVMLKNLRAPEAGAGAEAEAEQRLRSWAIQSDPSELERTLWSARGVNIYEMTVEDFVARLREKKP